MVKICRCQVCRSMLLDALTEGAASGTASMKPTQPTEAAALQERRAA